SSITGENSSKLDLLVDSVAAATKRGQQVIVVTSGAIATGMPLLGFDSKPEDLATSQALASVGQSRLISRYQTSLERYGLVAGQVLLTAGDLEGEETSGNANAALERLLELGVVPIVNENDTVATTEIRFGDNDRLAALVAVLAKADALILLSDVDALYTLPPSEPGAERIAKVAFEDEPNAQIGGSVSKVGTGGAITKVSAAKHAGEFGVSVLLTSALNVSKALDGHDVGTWFEAKG
ncbi:MAG: glutamate 5-kinase, partial [Micrococcales bacterium]